jgi:hypothetical protein
MIKPFRQLSVPFVAFGLISLAALGYSSARELASPIFGITIPTGYRAWQLVSVHATQGQLKSIWGNSTAIAAYRDAALPFPDGTVLVKQTWHAVSLNSSPSALVPGAPVHLQVMIKNSKKWPNTGGWGFGEWVDGKPTGTARHESCFVCHSINAVARSHDFVFTTFAK